MALRFNTTERRSRRSGSTSRARASCSRSSAPRRTPLARRGGGFAGGPRRLRRQRGDRLDRRSTTAATRGWHAGPRKRGRSRRAAVGRGRVLAVDGAEVDGWEALEAAARRRQARRAASKIERPQPLDDAAVARLATGERSESQTDELTLAIPRSRDLDAWHRPGHDPRRQRGRGQARGARWPSPERPDPRRRRRTRRELPELRRADPDESWPRTRADLSAREGALRTTRLRAEEELVEGRYDIEAMAQKIYRIGLAHSRRCSPARSSNKRLAIRSTRFPKRSRCGGT